MTRRTGVLAALSALLSGCSAAGVLNALVPRETYQGQEDVAYGPDPRQRLDVFKPLAPAGGQPPPIVVFFYGGSWTRGDRADYRFVGEALASSGAIVLVADYRLSPQVRYPDFLSDSAAAVKWAFDHARELGGDVSGIYVMGHSAGAYNAAMLALDPRWLAGVGLAPARLAGFIGIAGPYDFLPIENPDARVAFNWPQTAPDTQPINHVTAAAPRTLLLAPAEDKMVNPQRSTAGLAGRLSAAGVDVTLKLMDGVSHVTILASMARPLRRLAPVLPQVAAFLRLAPG
ncbi:MAG: alpha/beta hydrolase [Burkholderiales bacterium]|nr:alpha/beta hydrolase [Burkholderiales bacterium]